MQLITCVNFQSIDQSIQYAIICFKTDIFAEVEERLYKKFPNWRNTNNFFIQNAKQIFRFKTIAENNINDGFPVLMNNNETSILKLNNN